MPYLNWGCDLLAGECQSCLDALCNACDDASGKTTGSGEPGDYECAYQDDPEETDCEACELEEKPDCARCEIILTVCRNCGEYESCEFKIA
jgi:hypothetical protein